MATKKGSKSKKSGSGAKRGAVKAAAAKSTKKSSKSAKRPSTKGAARRGTPSRGAAAEAAPPRRGAVGAPSIPGNFHALYDRGFRESRGATPASPTPTETEGHRQLDSEVEGLGVHYDQATQLPKLVTVTPKRAGRGATLSARGATPAAATPEGAVTQFIEQRGDLWNLTPEDTATIEVISVSQPRSAAPQSRASKKGAQSRGAAGSDFNIGNLKTVNLVQRVEGREVFNSEMTAAVNADNEVISMAGQFFPGAGRGAGGGGSRGATARAQEELTGEEEAIARAVFDFTGVVYEAREFAPAATTPPDSGHYRFYEHTPSEGDTRPRFERPVRLKDVMFPLGGGRFVPGYYMELWVKGFPAFSYVMDAVDTPDVLYRKNLTSDVAFKYRVHNTGDSIFRPHDGPAPGTPHKTGKLDGFQAPTVAEKVITIESLLPGDPWLPPDATTTDGNNCIAYADLTESNAPGPGNPFGRVTSPRTFNQAYNHSKPASDPKNLQNSLVGMFFHVNWLHDRWYEAGFDEASGNAQKSNFGRGGVGGDPILAEGNDAEDTDNANMTTPADGASPRMQMFEFRGPETVPLPSRTSNHEALITFHEMGHYITHRLVGNSNGLFNLQGGAMSEGWGDFFAICMTSQSGDNFAKGVFAAGGWTDIRGNFKNNYYFSIRRYPYSADMTKNPLTFKHISGNVVLPTNVPISPRANPDNTQVHNVGEVWCSMLWEVFVNLVAKHGHAEAERRVLAYVIGGLKLTPPGPTFIQARDAIFAAVGAMAPGDLPEVRAGFAKRGMGSGAAGPPSNSETLSGVVESFTP